MSKAKEMIAETMKLYFGRTLVEPNVGVFKFADLAQAAIQSQPVQELLRAAGEMVKQMDRDGYMIAKNIARDDLRQALAAFEQEW